MAETYKDYMDSKKKKTGFGEEDVSQGYEGGATPDLTDQPTAFGEDAIAQGYGGGADSPDFTVTGSGTLTPEQIAANLAKIQDARAGEPVDYTPRDKSSFTVTGSGELTPEQIAANLAKIQDGRTDNPDDAGGASTLGEVVTPGGEVIEPVGDGAVGGGDTVDGGVANPPAELSPEEIEQQSQDNITRQWINERFNGDNGAAMDFLQGLSSNIAAGIEPTQAHLDGLPNHIKIALMEQWEQYTIDNREDGDTSRVFTITGEEGGFGIDDATANENARQREMARLQAVNDKWFGPPTGEPLSTEETELFNQWQGRLMEEYAAATRRMETEDGAKNWEEEISRIAGIGDMSTVKGITPEVNRLLSQMRNGLRHEAKVAALEKLGTAKEQVIKDVADGVAHDREITADQIGQMSTGMRAAYDQYRRDEIGVMQEELKWAMSGDQPPFPGQWRKEGNQWYSYSSDGAVWTYGSRVDARTGLMHNRFGGTEWPFRNKIMEKFKAAGLASVASEKQAKANEKLQADKNAAAAVQKAKDYEERLVGLEDKIRSGATMGQEDFVGVRSEDVYKLNDLTYTLEKKRVADEKKASDAAGYADKVADLVARIRKGEKLTEDDVDGVNMDDVTAGYEGGNTGGMGAEDDGYTDSMGAEDDGYTDSNEGRPDGTNMSMSEMIDMLRRNNAGEEGAQGDEERRRQLGLERYNRAEDIPESMQLAEQASIDELKNPDNSDVEKQMKRAFEDNIREIERQAIAQGLTWSGARQDALGRTVEDITTAATARTRADRDRAIQTGMSVGQQVFATKQAQRDFALREAQTTGYYGDQPVMQMLMQANEFDQAKMMQAGYTYKDPQTGEETRVLGIDQRADRDFLREEDIRNGYSQVQTWTDENGERHVVKNPHNGEPLLRKVMGTQELQEWTQRESARLQEKGIDADTANTQAALQWQKDQRAGFYAMVDTPAGPRQQWITGSVGLEREKMDLQKEMQDLGFDQQTSERMAQQAYDDKIREGYTTYQNGKQVTVRGTQAQDEYIRTLMNNFQMTEREATQQYQEEVRTGYWKEKEVGTNPSNGQPIMRRVHVEGTQDFATTEAQRQETLVRDGWNADLARDQAQFETAEKQRVGYYKVERRFSQATGQMEDVEVWQPGTQDHEDKIAADAREHDITIEQARYAHDAAMKDKEWIHTSFLAARADQLVKDGWSDADAKAEAQRTWQAGENELGRKFKDLLADKRLEAEQNRFDAEGHRDLMNASMGALGTIGKNLLPGVIDTLIGKDGSFNPQNWTKSGLLATGMTDSQADQFLSIGSSYLSDLGMPPGGGWEFVPGSADGSQPTLWKSATHFYDPATKMAWPKGDAGAKVPGESIGIGAATPGLLTRFGTTISLGHLSGAAAAVTGVVGAAAIAYGVYKAGSKIYGWYKDKKERRAERRRIEGEEREDTLAESRGVWDEMKNDVPNSVQNKLDEIWDDASGDYRDVGSEYGDQSGMGIIISNLDEMHEDGTFSTHFNQVIHDIAAAEKEHPNIKGNSVRELAVDLKWNKVIKGLYEAHKRGDLNPDRTAVVGNHIRGLLDSGAFDKEPDKWSRANRDKAELAWDAIPGVARTKGDDVSMEDKIRDLARFGSDMNLMGGSECQATVYDVVKEIGDGDLGNVSVQQETLVNQLVAQSTFGAGDLSFEDRYAYLVKMVDSWGDQSQSGQMGYDNERAG